MNVKLAKTPAEHFMLLGAERLLAKEDDQMLNQRSVDLFKLLIG
jgi:hypothetical protein